MAQTTTRPAGIEMELEVAAAPSRTVELEHLGELAEQTRIAFEIARDAFLRLEAAHAQGRPGTDENVTFRARVAVFREAAKAVHLAARVVRETSMGRREEAKVHVLGARAGLEHGRPPPTRDEPAPISHRAR